MNPIEVYVNTCVCGNQKNPRKVNDKKINQELILSKVWMILLINEKSLTNIVLCIYEFNLFNATHVEMVGCLQVSTLLWYWNYTCVEENDWEWRENTEKVWSIVFLAHVFFLVIFLYDQLLMCKQRWDGCLSPIWTDCWSLPQSPTSSKQSRLTYTSCF